VQHVLSKVHEETTFHSMDKEVFLDADGYGREESDDSYRSRVIVHGRRSQMVVQEGLEDRREIHTSLVGSGRRFWGV